MSKLSKRSVLRASLGFVAASALARPYIANAAAKTASVWWAQGFIPEEDASFKNMIAAYEKASGNTIDYNIVPFAPLNAKVISALTTGDVPDLISVDGSDRRIVPQNAWVDKLIDMTDVVDTQKSHYHPTALLASRYYNNVQKKRSVYLAPYKTNVSPFHVWNSLVEKAGYKLSDAPKTWDAYWDFFKPMQKSLREKGIAARLKHEPEVDAMIAAWTRQHDKREAMRVLGGAGVPAGAIFDTMELTEDADFEQRGIMQTMEHSIAGPFKMPGWPVRFGGRTPEVKPSPLLGQHTNEVLGEWLNLDADQIDQLGKDKII